MRNPTWLIFILSDDHWNPRGVNFYTLADSVAILPLQWSSFSHNLPWLSCLCAPVLVCAFCFFHFMLFLKKTIQLNPTTFCLILCHSLSRMWFSRRCNVIFQEMMGCQAFRDDYHCLVCFFLTVVKSFSILNLAPI